MQLVAQLIPIIALALHVNAHGVITAVTGTNGVTGQGFGVNGSAPRDGSRRDPFQQDTSIIRDLEIAQGTTGVCGRTLGGGNNNVEAQMTAASSAGLPMAAANGTVTMTLHQVNADGAGPYTCEVSADGTGRDFVQMAITQNVPGVAPPSLARTKDVPLISQMPAGTTCTGGPNGDACLVRCRNAAIAGPFGSCVAVTNAGSGNATATAAAGTGAAAGSVTTAADAASATTNGQNANGANTTNGQNDQSAKGLNGNVSVKGNANGDNAKGVDGGIAVDVNAKGPNSTGVDGDINVNGNADGNGAKGVDGGISVSGDANGGAGGGAVNGQNDQSSKGVNGNIAINGNANGDGAKGVDGGVVVDGKANSPGSTGLDGNINVNGNANGQNAKGVDGGIKISGTARSLARRQQQLTGGGAALETGNFTIPVVSIEEAEAALAQDLERRIMERVTRSRIFGRRELVLSYPEDSSRR